MAVTMATRHKLGVAMGKRGLADEVCDLIDTAASGTLSVPAKRALQKAFGREQTANLAITGIEASSAITDAPTLRDLTVALANDPAADDLNAGL